MVPWLDSIQKQKLYTIITGVNGKVVSFVLQVQDSGKLLFAKMLHINNI